MLLMFLAMEDSAQKSRAAQCPDEGLISRIAAGDVAALEAFYAQTKSAVYGFALSIMRNGPDAEDVMQDTFITLYSKAGSYQPQGKPMAWVLTIARNLAYMKLRAAGREDGELLNEPAAPPFEANSLDRTVLAAALSILSPEERQITLLHCVAGLKHRETADLLTLPLGTVLSKYRRALAKLQKYLQEVAP